MANLTQFEWTEKLAKDKNAVILDVRTLAELQEGIIPNAIHLDIFMGKEFIDELNRLDKKKDYYVYCRSGNRSGQACSIMEQMGFQNAYNLSGGMLEWQGEVVAP